jgi:tetratricopeptide (TPR) repeat protein
VTNQCCLFNKNSNFISAIRAFLCALYKDSYFQRVNEIHFRLGLIYKELNEIPFSLKHFKLALIDTSSSLSSVTKCEIKLCIAQLYETNSEHFEAIEKYEELIKFTPSSADDSPNLAVDSSLKAKAYRHLGWLYFYSDTLSKLSLTTNDDKQIDLVAPLRQELRQQQLSNTSAAKQQLNRKSLQLTLEYLSKSAQLDSTQNATWYYYGRALACKGNSREAFVSYKNSVNNPEANGDTWCSIGILYYQQRQFMDSLQAFICAIQLDRSHYSAWLNLAILYEQDNQLEEALKCYRTAIRCHVQNAQKQRCVIEDARKKEEAKSTGLDVVESALEEDSEEFKHLCERTKLLVSYFDAATEKMKDALKNSQPHVLPMLQEAFSLQIPTELRQKIVNSNQLDQYNIGLGITASSPDGESPGGGKGSSGQGNSIGTASEASDSPTNQKNGSSRVLTSLTSNTSPSKVQLNIQQQQSESGNNNNSTSSSGGGGSNSGVQMNQAGENKLKSGQKKGDQIILLKPQQIQLMVRLF